MTTYSEQLQDDYIELDHNNAVRLYKEHNLSVDDLHNDLKIQDSYKTSDLLAHLGY